MAVFKGVCICVYTTVLIHFWKCALLTSEDTFMHLLARKNIIMIYINGATSYTVVCLF